MSNFSKIVIIILIVLSFLFIKENYGTSVEKIFTSISGIKNIKFDKIKENSEEIIKTASEKPVQKKEKQEVAIYFLALDENDNSIYKKVTREIPTEQNKLEFAIKELLKGPSLIEKSMGAYSEIPKETRLLGIKQDGNKIIIDFSSDFQYGGGTDSIYSRIMQLVKTSVSNTKNKKIYLYLDGKIVNIIGGEGIMITQPLNEKSLEI